MLAISAPSVETITRSTRRAAKACSIDQAIRGLPARSFKFLWGIPLDPALAGMKARYVMVPLRISAVLEAWRPSSGRKAKYQEIQITSFARRRRYRAVPDCCILATHLIG